MFAIYNFQNTYFTTINLTFCDIGFSGIKKMPLIYIFSVIIIGFSDLAAHYLVFSGICNCYYNL